MTFKRCLVHRALTVSKVEELGGDTEDLRDDGVDYTGRVPESVPVLKTRETDTTGWQSAGAAELLASSFAKAKEAEKQAKEQVVRLEKLVVEQNKKLRSATLKAKASGKGCRVKFDGKVVKGNDKETASLESLAFKNWSFKGDEGAFIRKDVISKDRQTKTTNYKCVLSRRYMGGLRSDPADKYCNGAVAWECSGGSEALKVANMSSSQFKIRCGAEKRASDAKYCSKCLDKKTDFFSGTYTITKGKSVEHNNKTYKDFITENLEYVAEH